MTETFPLNKSWLKSMPRLGDGIGFPFVTLHGLRRRGDAEN